MDDRAKFERLFRAHVAAVRAYALRRTDAATAEDVVADTFLVCWRRLDAVPENALPWLYGVARRALANRRRAARRADAVAARAVAAAGSGVSAGREELAGVLQAMTRLSERDREVLRLDAWEGLDGADGARAAGCSVSAYRVRLHRARRRLAVLLEDESAAPQLMPVREGTR
jgi:RNA polymerase sigma-70 factor, ECF subfamily